MGDIAVWYPYLERVLAVEMEERFIPDLVDKAYTLGLVHKLFYYVGDIDQILQNGIDIHGHDLQTSFPVDLVNLDYCSGLIYEGFERIAALESLFRSQADSLTKGSKRFPYFLLYITHCCHPTAGKQKTSKEYIDYLGKDINLYEDHLQQSMIATLNWYASDQCPLAYRHKVFVLGKVLQFAQNVGFHVSVKAAIAYTGDSGVPMIHYQFEVRPRSIGSPIPVNSNISIPDILDLPVIDISGNDIAGNTRPRINESKMEQTSGA
jgi:hypothetical protein